MLKAKNRQCLGHKRVPVLEVGNERYVPSSVLDALAGKVGLFNVKRQRTKVPDMVVMRMRYIDINGDPRKKQDCFAIPTTIKIVRSFSPTLRKSPDVRKMYDWVTEKIDMIQPDLLEASAAATPAPAPILEDVLKNMTLAQIVTHVHNMGNQIEALELTIQRMKEERVSIIPLKSEIKSIVGKYVSAMAELHGKPQDEVYQSTWRKLHKVFTKKTGLDAMKDAKDMDKSGLEVVALMGKLEEFKACLHDVIGL